ncbi:MAG: hypothetical protein INF43_05105, partial [Alphaproteobacteria bacterium]|nr:hypothetical protein [Alphaproteobacteria bacterium]
MRLATTALSLAGLATALTGGTLAVRSAHALERVAQPTTNLNSAATQTKIDENRTRVNCVDGALNQRVMTCPQDCMIPTTNVSVT